jgi:non-heme chloroperoxidase
MTLSNGCVRASRTRAKEEMTRHLSRSIRTSGCSTATSARAHPLVLLHGWTMTHQVWDRQVRELGARHRLVLPDFRGHGDSAKPLRSYMAGSA